MRAAGYREKMIVLWKERYGLTFLSFTKNRIRSSLFITLLAAAIPATALADAKLELAPPAGVPASALTVTVHKGIPASSSITDAIMARDTVKVIAETDGSYKITKAGTYCYYLKATDYYSVCKLFNVTDAQVSNNETIQLELQTSAIGADGYEPGNPGLVNAPSDYSTILDNRDKILGIWPDEVLEHFKTDTLVGYQPMTTPAFTETFAEHQFTSQAQMMSFLNNLAAKDSRAHLFTLGKTANYSFDMPLVIVTTSAIPENAAFEDAAKIIRGNGKLNVWHQGQIHPNEPAAGEAVLVMLEEMLGDFGKTLLDQVNFIAIPRLNPDGSYLFTRVTYGGFDMNRDHMRLKAIELDYAHRAFSAIMPEVAMDSHEFTYYGASSTDLYMNNADDIQSTPASSLNNNAAVNEFAMKTVSSKIHQDLKAAGLRNNHYGFTVNNPIGRAYYGLFDTISILIETRGIGAGRQNFPRRVFSQVTAAKSITQTAAGHAASIRTMVAQARDEIITKGRTYETSDTLALFQTASGYTQTPFVCDRVLLNMDGTERSSTRGGLSMNDTVVRERVRPTAYIIPKDAQGINLDLAMYITDGQGGEYYEIAPGTAASVQQYYYDAPYVYGAVRRGFTAGLRAEEEVTFANGAYVIPMDQVSGNVLGMLWEPDVNDSNGYDGTLAQSGIVTYDSATMNYPYYRFIGDNPRAVLPAQGSTSGSSGGCAAGFGVFALVTVIGGAFVLRRRG